MEKLNGEDITITLNGPEYEKVKREGNVITLKQKGTGEVIEVALVSEDEVKDKSKVNTV